MYIYIHVYILCMYLYTHVCKMKVLDLIIARHGFACRYTNSIQNQILYSHFYKINVAIFTSYRITILYYSLSIMNVITGMMIA